MSTRTTVDIPIEEILRDDSFNCRSEITYHSVLGLAEDIKDRGLDTPITVMPYNKDGYKYKIVTGHRRYTACKYLRHKTIECFIDNNCNDIQAAIKNLQENVQRQELNILEEAKGCAAVQALGFSPAEIARKLSQGTRWVNIRLVLLRLPKHVQDHAANGNLKPREIEMMGDLLAGERSVDDIIKYANKCIDRRILDDSPSLRIFKEFQSKIARDPDVIKVRPKAEIEQLLDHLIAVSQDNTNLAITVLGWVLSGTSTVELLTEVAKELRLLGINYNIPHSYVENDSKERERLGLSK